MTANLIQQKRCFPIAALAFSLTLVGCAAKVSTPYQNPAVDIPTTFQQQKSSNKNLTLKQEQLDRWWTLFGDTQLNQLVQQVLEKNSNLAVAGITLQKARLQAGLSKDQQGLRQNASISTGHSYDFASNSDSSSGLSVNAGVSYELDLFGKLSKQTEASQWEAIATEQDLQATAQSLIGNTVNLYWQLAYLHERQHYAQQNLATSQKLLNLVKVQYKAGAVSGIELTQAEQALQSQKASVSQIQQQLVETRTALAVLLHQSVQQLQLQEPKKLGQIQLPNIAAGLPAELLARRPDLQAAEYRLRKVLANKDATKASYYPSISLTGNLGSKSVSLVQLIQNPVLALGASVNLPFLQVNDMKKNLAISDLDYEKAIIEYRQTLYQAFADVENALSARTQLNQQVDFQKKNLDLAQKSQRLTEVRYKHGEIALKNVLDAQQTTRSAYLSWLQTKQSQYQAYVTLLQALGGSPIQSQ
ncbi:MAG: efflux transporter outer membrane subunit [Acinetobacter sp.]|nr:efflux transporter outer membrane subunit [Acinetobacter sp.]